MMENDVPDKFWIHLQLFGIRPITEKKGRGCFKNPEKYLCSVFALENQFLCVIAQLFLVTLMVDSK